MINKVIFIFVLIILQNFFLIKQVYSAQEYIEVDKIIAIVETQTITNSELNKKIEQIIILSIMCVVSLFLSIIFVKVHSTALL